MVASRTGLGRPREFDVDVALDAAMRQFWEHGYHATSLTDLTDATGLHRGSLYAAFGDKHRLFLDALRRYARESLALMDADLRSEPSPLGGVRRYLERQAAQAADQATGGRGCLIANTTLELLPGDGEVARVVTAQHRAVVDRLAGALDRARAVGELPGTRSTTTLARYLFTVVEGLWELGRTTPDPKVLSDVVEAAMSAVS